MQDQDGQNNNIEERSNSVIDASSLWLHHEWSCSSACRKRYTDFPHWFQQNLIPRAVINIHHRVRKTQKKRVDDYMKDKQWKDIQISHLPAVATLDLW